MMNKILTIVLVLFIAGAAFSAPSAAQERVTAYGNMIYLEGRLPAYDFDERDSITVMMIRKDADVTTPAGILGAIGYLNEIYPDFDGNYKCLFEFEDDPSQYTLRLRAGERDVTDSVIQSGAFSDMVDIKIYDGATDGVVEFYMETIDRYLTNKPYTAVFATYAADGSLYDCLMYDHQLNGQAEQRETLRRYLKKPENMLAAKAFVLNSRTDIMPLDQNVSKTGNVQSDIIARYIDGEGFSVEKTKGFNRSCVNEYIGSYVNSEGQTVSVSPANVYGAVMKTRGSYAAYENVDLTDMVSLELYAGAKIDGFRLDIMLDDPINGEKIGTYTIHTDIPGETTAVYGGVNLNRRVNGVHTLYIKDSTENQPGNETDVCQIKFLRLTNKAYEQHVVPQVYNQDSDTISYTEGWTDAQAVTPFCADAKSSVTPNAKATFQFQGTAVDFNSVIGPEGGYVDVYLDGVFDTTLNLYHEESLARCVYTKANLEDGAHTLTIENITAKKLYVDSFKVYHDPIRVLCIGDSITQGTGSTDQGKFSWPSQLASMLGDGYVVFNNARHGCTLQSWQGDWMYRSAQLLDADIIICAIGTNDYVGGWGTFQPQAYQQAYQTLMQALAAQSQTPPRVYVARPPLRERTAYAERGAVWEMFEHLSKQNNWPIIDFLEPLLAQQRNFCDGLHLNDRGLGVMAEIANASLPCPELINQNKLNFAISEMNKRNANFLNIGITD